MKDHCSCSEMGAKAKKAMKKQLSKASAQLSVSTHNKEAAATAADFLVMLNYKLYAFFIYKCFFGFVIYGFGCFMRKAIGRRPCA